MKNPRDPRHRRRQLAVEALFAQSFPSGKVSPRDATTIKVIAKVAQIDTLIEEAAPEFPVQRINKIDLAILRLAVFELVFAKKEPPKVIIDEAVELGKEFGGETSPSFINGVLGNIYGGAKT